MRKWVLSIVGIVVVGLALMVVSEFQRRNTSGFNLARGLPSCGNDQVLFSQSPLAFGDFTHITPLGLLSPTAHTLPTQHLYFNVRTDNPGDEQAIPAKVPAVAPGDLTIREITFTDALNKPEWSDYGARFAVCGEVVGYFDHISSLAPKLQAAYDAGTTLDCSEYTLGYGERIGSINYRFCRKRVELTLKAGEAIGTAGGSTGQRVYDFALFDKRIEPATLANSARWTDGREHTAQVVCAINYFTPALTSKLEPLLGGSPSGEGPRTIEPRCGQVHQDLSGTAQGVWVPPDIATIQHDPPMLALVHDNIDPRIAVFSVGERPSAVGISSGLYHVDPGGSGLVNRDFSDIAADGQTYCFETHERQNNFEVNPPVTTLLVTMPDATTLHLGPGPAGNCGSGPWTLTKFVEFVR